MFQQHLLHSLPCLLLPPACSFCQHLSVVPKYKYHANILIVDFVAAVFKMTSALVFLAEGAEEMELVITADILRRAGVGYNFTCPVA